MYWNYLKLAWRNIFKQKGYSLINILGLTVGIAALILIYFYIQDELSYDQHWQDKDRIYRINESMNLSGQEDHFAPTNFNMSSTFEREFPEVEVATHLMFCADQTIRKGEDLIDVDKFYYADSNFFKIFNVDIVAGSAENAFTDPNSVVLKEDVAKRFFPHRNPVGQTLQLDGQDFKITAVIRDLGHNTHLDFNGLRSIYILTDEMLEQYRHDWFRICCYTYFKTYNPLDLYAFTKKVDRWTAEIITPWIKENNVDASASFRVQPITDIHFDLSRSYDHQSNTNKKYIYIFGAIGIFLILIAAINYVNMATARSIRRAKEVGIRKVSGANTSQLFSQFITESLLLTLIAAIFGMMLAELSMPVFNGLLNRTYSIADILHKQAFVEFTTVILTIWLVTGFLSGIYPAVVMSHYQPTKALKSGVISSTKSGWFSTATLRKGLVILQFAISIAMIFSTIVVYTQLEYMHTKSLGFDQENILIFNNSSESTALQKIDVFKQELLQHPNIEKVATSTSFPGYRHGRLLFYINNDGEEFQKTMSLTFVDHDFMHLLNLKLKDGRFFSQEIETDATESFVINEAAVRFLGLNNPVGLEMMCGLGVDGKVIGVIEDYNYESLHKNIEPLVMILNTKRSHRIAVKMTAKDPETQAQIESAWYKYDQDHPFYYRWLENHLNKMYHRENNMLQIFMYFTLLVLFIACLGLLALAAYTAEQKTKENGIRKTLGGSIAHIIGLQVRETTQLICIAGVVAAPLSWMLMQRWLQDFAYAITIKWYFSAIAILLAVMIAFFTVILIAYHAAKANPVEALKYE